MAFASRDAIRAARSAGRKQDWVIHKTGAGIPEAAGQWVSFAADAGTPGAITDPTTYANCTSLSGSMTFSNVTPGNRYLTGCALMATQNCTLMVYDRLGHIGAQTLHTSTGDRSISSSALPRSMSTNDLLNVEAWIELTTATTTTAAVVRLNSYTNEAGTTGHTGGSLTLPDIATNVRWMGRLPLAAGDKAVQAVSTFEVTTATTNGVCNLMLIRPVALIPLLANVATVIQFDDLERIYDGSSLCLAAMASAASAFNVWGRLEFTYDA